MKIGIFVYNLDPNYKGGVASYVFGVLGGFNNLVSDNIYYLICSKNNYLSFKNRLIDYKNIRVVNADEKTGDQSLSFLRKKIVSLFTNYITILPVFNFIFSAVFNLFYQQLFSFIDQQNFDILYIPYAFPVEIKAPVVASLHDIQHTHYPEFFSWLERRQRKIYFRETVRRAKIIQASSEYMAADFKNYFTLTNERVAVIRDGVAPLFKEAVSADELIRVKNKYNLACPFIFYPAQHWLHKNHQTLIEAVELLEDKYKIKYCLVFTGEKNDKFNHLYDYISKSKIKGRIKLIGHVPNEDLICLYKLSFVTVMPSLHESNSLVVLEALAAGSAVIASDIEPNREINQDSILLFNRLDRNDLADKIILLLNNPAKTAAMIKKGQELMGEMTWENTAKKYLQVFSRLLEQKNQ